ncbi:hypothetical protein BAUCODRAFT_82446 [Baudoinia panamericana UAMH 10762]|uniref:Carboxylic ester hydrolase n=1 Tax=Baudoinia panamericana (strain UAMH 10762) TaxID=717646 RepID=M2NAN7_BAUPA|nr:uncharacterized protein BAUCODRAFT_82446 [Baudoinia panamericana UAMH 10762]EMD01294.1 hypothetical protein BAUCODRAFT_82446 [Baudoinia panamericana UAMH 10762]
MQALFVLAALLSALAYASPQAPPHYPPHWNPWPADTWPSWAPSPSSPSPSTASTLPTASKASTVSSASAAPASSSTSTAGGAPAVTLKNGTVSGLHSSTYNQDFFLGVPFAQPPVGELRFTVPQSLNTTLSSIYQATQYAPECVGYGGDDIGYPTSEDCLYLNVIRPSGYSGQALPVGVWIHGGGLYMGGTIDQRYNLSFIVQNSVAIGKPIIGVSIGYRLSAWGFLASKEVRGSGNTNLGLRDQRLALHWLQENIGAFGGDPTKVTIWGESAGALSVGFQLTAYNGRDDKLFRAGIMESGNPVNYNSFLDVDTYQPLYNAMVNATGCSAAVDTLDCLRQVPFATLNGFLNTTQYANAFSRPIVDGDFVARFQSIQLKEGAFVKVPIIDGANTDEGTAFGQTGINNTADFITRATSNTSQAYLPAALGPTIANLYPNECDYWDPPPSELSCDFTYPASYGAQYRRSAAYFGDVVMVANRRGACQAWTRNGVPAYCYRFNTRPAGLPVTAGVTHFQEVAFVFDNINGYGYNAAHGTINPFTNVSSLYIDLAKLMSNSWASFIYDQNPNNYTGRPAQTPAWPVYDNSNPQDIVWDGNVTSLAYPEPDTFRQAGIQWIIDNAIAYNR